MGHVVLPDALTIASVEASRAALLAAFDQAGGVHIDGSAVLDVDGAGVQLLLAAAKEAQLRRVDVRLAASTKLRDTLAMLALDDRIAQEGTP